jgi:hypothetical protein
MTHVLLRVSICQLFYIPVQIITPASKYINGVILSSAKNLVFLLCYKILHFVQDDNFNCRVNNSEGIE